MSDPSTGADSAAAGGIRLRPKQMVRRRKAVRFTADLQLVPEYSDACVRYLWYENDVDGQAVGWEGPGFYVRWVLGGTWTILGVDAIQARRNTDDRISAYKRQQRQQRRAEREPVDPGELAEDIAEGANAGFSVLKLILSIVRLFGGGK